MSLQSLYTLINDLNFQSRVIYSSMSYACAMLEVLVHTGIGRIPKNHCAITITIPASIEIEQIAPDEIPGWDHPDMHASRIYGDSWLTERRTSVLCVPSYVARYDWNVLINPNHSDFGEIQANEPELVMWDHRLFEKR